jgi:cell wall-associated NlpC family hydrolase
MSQDHRITRLVSSVGKTRTLEYDDGTIETRTGGSASWRNNNPGNLKFEFSGSADRTTHSGRTRDQALVDARRRYDGIVGLDQWGNAVFESLEAGEAAQLKLLTRRFHAQTVEQLVEGYSKSDYSGGTHHTQQIASIHRTARELGVDLHGKTVDQMSEPERHALARGIQKFEGFHVGETNRAEHGIPAATVRSGAAAIYAEADLHFFRSGTTFEYGRPDNTKPGRDASRTEQDLDHDGKRGVDCSAFVWRALKNAGYAVAGDDARDFSTHTLVAGANTTSYARAHFHVIPADEARRPNGTLSQGDIVLFSDGHSQHVGIFKGYDASGNIQFIGSQSSTGPETVTVKPHGYWDGGTTRIVGALRAKPEFQTHAPLHAAASAGHDVPGVLPTSDPRHTATEHHPSTRSTTQDGQPRHARHTQHHADPAVREEQRALNLLGARDAHGVPLVEDGLAGRHTREAVKGFQHEHGLPASGRMGMETRRMLDAAHGLRITDTAHPDYPLFERTLGLVQSAEAAKGIPSGPHSANLAASLVVQMREDGLSRADRVELGNPPRYARVVQASPDGTREHELMATVDVRAASSQSLHRSSDLLAQLPAREMAHHDQPSRAHAPVLAHQ